MTIANRYADVASIGTESISHVGLRRTRRTLPRLSSSPVRGVGLPIPDAPGSRMLPITLSLDRVAERMRSKT